MVQFIPARNTWSDVGENFASGLSQGYMNRSDDRALQNAIQGIENPSPRQILDAIVGTRTYSPQSKQNLLKNYLGVAEFEEMQAKNKTAKEVADLKKIEEANKKANEEKEKRGSAKALVEASDLEQDMKDRIYAQIEAGEVGLDAIKEITKGAKKSEKKIEKEEAAQAGLDIIDRMRKIGTGGNLGRGSSWLKMFGGQAAKDFGEYEQLGKSLIQLSTNIPIRNRQEFETLAHNLYDPTIPDSEREGVLNAIETIIKGTLPGQESKLPAGERPPLESFMR